jgi:hypothetical protein
MIIYWVKNALLERKKLEWISDVLGDDIGEDNFMEARQDQEIGDVSRFLALKMALAVS